jgi:transposase
MDMHEFGRILTAERKPNGQFSPEAVAAIVAFAICGQPHSAIAKAFGTRRRETITNLVRRVTQRKTTKPKKRSGRPRRLTSRKERYVFQLIRRKPRATWKEICVERDALFDTRLRTFSARTAKRALRKRHIGHWRAAKRILLTKEDAIQRLRFCREWSSKDAQELLLRCLFSDECTIQNEPSKPGEWVFRYARDRFREDLVNPLPHSRPRISLMVWGMVWQRDDESGMSPLIFCEGDPDSARKGFTSARYMEVLEEGLVPLYEAGDLFMQDNARIHRSHAVRDFLESKGIWTIKWPAHSPDLNPIEQVWRALKLKIYEIEPRFQYLKDNINDYAYAREIIELAWSELDHSLISKLLKSIPRRIAAVLRARGWYSHY